MIRKFPFCECGCGYRVAKINNRFISGHNRRGRPCFWRGKKNPEHSKRMSGKGNPNFGNHLSEEHKRKIGLANSRILKGRKLSENHKKKISEGNKGRVFSEETRRKISAANKGMKREPISENHKAILRKAARGNTYGLGYKHTKEAKRKISRARKGKTYEEIFGVERGMEMRGKRRKERSKKKIPVKDSSIELIVQSALRRAKLVFDTHVTFKDIGVVSNKYLYHQVDIYIPLYKLIVECDGNYWHDFPEQRRRDRRQTLDIKAGGFYILRLKEDDIRRHEDSIERGIIDFIDYINGVV